MAWWQLITTITASFTTPLYRIYDYAVIQVIKKLYLHGPGISSYGFWQGRAPHEICAMIAGNAADFWNTNQHTRTECQALIDAKFNTWIIAIETVTYFIVLYSLVCSVGYSLGGRICPRTSPRCVQS